MAGLKWAAHRDDTAETLVVTAIPVSRAIGHMPSIEFRRLTAEPLVDIPFTGRS